jgi:hypothetical protein
MEFLVDFENRRLAESSLRVQDACPRSLSLLPGRKKVVFRHVLCESYA